jgi:rhamnosyltransferase
MRHSGPSCFSSDTLAMMDVAASVIVRARNEEQQIARAMASIRSQTVPVEVVVVDSGSSDRTVAIAERWCDRLVEIPPESFTYGHALNIGARESSAPIHVALSAHCALTRTDWVERAITLYERPEIAAVTGMPAAPGGAPIRAGVPFLQRQEDVAAYPLWGFSNHASSWRATVWERHPFDPTLDAAEDKEWALRVLRAGFTIAYEAELYVDMSHQWTSGALALFRRRRLERRAMRSFLALDRYSLRAAVREWWTDMPDARHSPFAHRFLNHRRLAELAGTYVGDREAERSRGSD